jgi:ribose transport system substrate-binding protein
MESDPLPPDRVKSSPRYYIDVLGKALDVIDVLGRHQGELRLTEVAEACQIDKATVFRILYTLERRGFVFRDAHSKKFRLAMGYRRYRVGYAQLSGTDPFSRAVTRGLAAEAKLHQMELLIADNRYEEDTAMRNAEWMIEQKVDFAIEYQIHAQVSPALSALFAKARIPTLAIDIPQPRAVYFGVDNYAAGLMGGETLGRYAQTKWRGRVDRLALLEIYQAGPTPHARITGTVRGLRNVLPNLRSTIAVRRDGKGTEAGGYETMRKIFRSMSPRDHLLIAAANDSIALGALQAVRECGHQLRTAVIGHGFTPDPSVHQEIRRPDSPFIGSVAFFPERYGSKIIPLVIKWLNHDQIPPSNHMSHVVVTKNNIDQFAHDGNREPAEEDLAQVTPQ